MNHKYELLRNQNTDELVLLSRELIGWQYGAVRSLDEVAEYMCKGGPYFSELAQDPKKSQRLSSEFERFLEVKHIIYNYHGALPPGRDEDPRPPKKYWEYVKKEFFEFLCNGSEKYNELWSRLGKLESKSTTLTVTTIAAYFGDQIGVGAGVLAGFVAVCLYGVTKIGKESLCEYLKPVA